MVKVNNGAGWTSDGQAATVADWLPIFTPTALADFTATSGTWTAPASGEFECTTNGGYLAYDIPQAVDIGEEIAIVLDAEYTVSPGSTTRFVVIYPLHTTGAAPNTGSIYASARPDGQLAIEIKATAGVESHIGTAIPVSTYKTLKVHYNSSVLRIVGNGDAISSRLSGGNGTLRRVIIAANDGASGTTRVKNIKVYVKAAVLP